MNIDERIAEMLNNDEHMEGAELIAGRTSPQQIKQLLSDVLDYVTPAPPTDFHVDYMDKGKQEFTDDGYRDAIYDLNVMRKELGL